MYKPKKLYLLKYSFHIFCNVAILINIMQLDKPIWAQSVSLDERIIQYSEKYLTLGSEKIYVDPIASINDLSRAIRLNPSNAKPYFLRGLARSHLGYLSEDKDSNVPEYTESISEIWDGAISDFSKAISINPDLTHAYFYRGLLLGQRDVKSIEDFNEVLKVNPKLSVAFYYRGLSKLVSLRGIDSQSTHKAARDFAQAIEIDPQLTAVYYALGFAISGLRGDATFNDTEVIEGNQYFLKMIQSNPTFDPSRNYSLIEPSQQNTFIHEMNKLRNNDLFQFIDQATLAINRDSYNPENLYRRGFLNIRARNYQAAIKDFEQAISIDVNNSDSFYGLALSYYQLQMHRNSIKQINTAIRLDSETPDYHFLKALILFDSGKYTSAVDSLNTVIQLDPAFANAYFIRSIAFYRLGQIPKANQDYWKARSAWLSIGPGNAGSLQGDPATFLKRGQLLIRRGDRNGALQNLREAAYLFQAQGNKTSLEKVERIIQEVKQ